MLPPKPKLPKKPEPAKITGLREDETLTQGETPLVRVELALPQIGGKAPRRAAQKINSFYALMAGQLKRHAKGPLLKEAVAAYALHQADGGAFWKPCTLRAAYTVTLNEKGILSLYCDVTQHTGGAQTDTVRLGCTWSLADGLPLPPKLPRRRKAVRSIQREAMQRETRRPGSFLPKFRAALRRHYDPRDCYLTPKGAVVFYPPGAVAPYEAGAQEFVL